MRKEQLIAENTRLRAALEEIARTKPNCQAGKYMVTIAQRSLAHRGGARSLDSLPSQEEEEDSADAAD